MPSYQRDQSNLPHSRHHSYSLHRARADIKRMANRCGRLHCEAIRYPVANFTMQQPNKKPDESKRTINRSFLHHNAYSPAIGQRHSVSRLHQQSDRSNTQTFGKFRSLCPTSGSRIRYIPYTAVHQVQKGNRTDSVRIHSRHSHTGSSQTIGYPSGIQRQRNRGSYRFYFSETLPATFQRKIPDDANRVQKTETLVETCGTL